MIQAFPNVQKFNPAFQPAVSVRSVLTLAVHQARVYTSGWVLSQVAHVGQSQVGIAVLEASSWHADDAGQTRQQLTTSK